MIYGTTNVHRVRDVTDLIGIRVLLLRQRWQPTTTSGTLSEEELDAQKPAAPSVPGGLLLMGEQSLKERGHYSTIWTFQGVNGNGKDLTFKTRGKSFDYGFEPGFSQVPIQVHPKFTKMLPLYQGYASNDGTTVIWPPELVLKDSSGSSLTLSPGQSNPTNPMYGIQAFFEMDGVYRYRYAERELPVTLQSGVGFIADKEKVPGKPPELADGRNWLKAPAAYQRKGNIYDITEYFWLSRRGGWPIPVYREGVLG